MWQDHLATYVSAVMEFVVKMNLDFDSTEIKFVWSIRAEPQMYLSVECGTVFQ
jgi:hypothetical protein